ncbi:hypothetical protein DFH94DRAFT_807783 [Russula ochroleuca]|uniref:Uncharacterized protein n=1 Tax=Russula ochroleuca TaxID=152965 RepID=A0A9P5N3G9_9AGAM|nr:hypothetical protein DFH94DRAFT_807783 [Russula ochroleuca]
MDRDDDARRAIILCTSAPASEPNPVGGHVMSGPSRPVYGALEYLQQPPVTRTQGAWQGAWTMQRCVFGLFWGTIGLHAAFTTFIFSFVICYFFDNNTRLRPEPDVQHVMERLVHVINATVHSVQRPSAECCQPENWTVRYEQENNSGRLF